MSDQEIFETIKCLVVDLFGIDASEVTIETSRESIDGWDSLQHVNLIMDLESQFGIHLSESQIAHIQSIRDAVNVVAAEQSTSA